MGEQELSASQGALADADAATSSTGFAGSDAGQKRVMQDIWEEFIYAKEEFEDGVATRMVKGSDFTGLRHDPYDMSLEIDGATVDLRLSDDLQQFIHASGFRKTYLNHTDGVLTIYDWEREFAPVPGWRRKPQAGGGFIVSYWPDTWNKPTSLNWRETGYVIVDPELGKTSAVSESTKGTAQRSEPKSPSNTRPSTRPDAGDA